jgi:D-hexose-6-phosphate mutarotase
MTTTVADLRSLELPGAAAFHLHLGGLVALDIATPLARARIFVHGAHVAEWTPAGQEPVLFMSEQSHFAAGKAIRGGVPICFPWFGGRAAHPQSPAHGFVRTVEWTVESLAQEPGGTVVAIFAIADSEATRAYWPHAFRARLRVRIGQTLELSLAVENTGPEPFTYEDALHTYFCVADVRSAEVTGLEGAEFIDKVEAFARKRQPAEPLRFTGETDRVFPNTTTTCVLHDPGLRREVVVEKTGSATTVVWNPWIAKAKAMADFGDDEWPGMACIETANAGENALTLAPGATHTTTARISVR